ncbi:MAG: toll/interleukin-1 receptor domain-containing protein [Clostridia bacterium]|nr:toll/interleukin-1 receptor domain-containing protein [Clostridia bacterium]
MERPISYEGNENYIFISYSHKDSARVWPIIEQMQKDGYRIWYDDGIDPGTEWDENIARHVKECSFFIAFMSENYLASDNCKDELNYSRDLDKKQLIIYLDKVELPPALTMRIGRNQAIAKYGMDDAEFYEKLYDAQDIEYQHKDNKAPKITLERPQEVHVQTDDNKKKLLPVIIIAALLISAVVGGVILMKGSKNNDAQLSGTTTAEVTQATESTEAELKQLTNVEIYDDEYIKVKALGIRKDSRYVTFEMAVQNKKSVDMSLTSGSAYIDGVNFEARCRGDVTANGINQIEMTVPVDEIKKYYVDPDNITMFETGLSMTMADDSASPYTENFIYYPYGEENASFAVYEVQEDDTVLVDNEEALIVVHDAEGFEGSNYRWQEFIFVNRTDEYKHLDFEREYVNGYFMDSHYGLSADAGYTTHKNINFELQDVEKTGYTQLLEHSGEMFIHSYMEKYKPGAKTYPFVIYPEGEEAAKALAPRQLEEDELVYEDEYFRIGYLGSIFENDQYDDVFHIYNHSENDRYINMHLTWPGGDYGSYSNSVLVPAGKQLFINMGHRESLNGGREKGHLGVRSSGYSESSDDEMENEAFLTMRDPE